jgi:hypothetical protein
MGHEQCILYTDLVDINQSSDKQGEAVSYLNVPPIYPVFGNKLGGGDQNYFQTLAEMLNKDGLVLFVKKFRSDHVLRGLMLLIQALYGAH